jgi:hypothetical protein
VDLDPSYVTRLHALLARHNNEHTNGRYTRFYVAEAKALERLLQVFEQMVQVQDARPPALVATCDTAGDASFIVSVVAGGKHGASTLLQWDTAPNAARRVALQGKRYACFPVDEQKLTVAPAPTPAPAPAAWPFPPHDHKEPGRK